MWVNFAISCLFLVFLLYVPGCLVFGKAAADRKILIAWAPIVSLFLICLVGCLSCVLNIRMTGWAIACALILASILIGSIRMLACRRKCHLPVERHFDTSDTGDSLGILLLYLCLGVAVSAYAFISVIGSPDWFSVSIDNAYHLNELYAMASMGQFSPFSISTFPTVQGYGSSDGSSFYPALWHVVAAILLDSAAVTTPVAENATNFVFVAIVFPLGVWAFLVSTLGGNKRAVAAGSLTCVCFFDFPWRLLTYGLLCANLAAFAMVPVALSVFASLVSAKDAYFKRFPLIILLIAAVICLALLQPNAVFSCIVLIAPYCVWQMLYGEAIFGFSVRKRYRRWLSIAFVGLCIAVWIIAYNASFMQSVLAVSWDHYSSKTQGVFNILFLSYCRGPVNLVAAFLVIVGVISVLRKKELRWLACSYLLCAIIHFSTASTESVFKHWLSGFWYTDQYRTAALCVLAAIPLSAIGLASVVAFCERLVRALKKGDVLLGAHKGTSKTVALIFAVLLLLPNFTLNGLGEVGTTFGVTRALVKSEYDMSDKTTLSEEEVAFVREAKQIVGDDLVLNSPFDGTAFLYGVTGVQFYYRSLLYSPDNDPNEPSESRVLRHSLSSFADDEEARLALERTNAKYVLLLDSSQRVERFHPFTYRADDWTGIDSVDESIEGFDLVLEKGDMKLYKITAV